MNRKVHPGKGFVVSSTRLVIIALLLVAVSVAGILIWKAGKTSTPNVPTPDYWPTTGWRSSSPEAQGIDSDKLADLLLGIREQNVQIHSLLIIRHGYMVLDATFYPYDGKTPHNVASVTKSLMTTLIGIAADQGKLDLDDKMVSFFPDRTIANLDERKQDITVRHLVSMSSGLDCAAEPDEPTLKEMEGSPDWVQFVLDRKVVWEPGQQFMYCSPAIHVLSPILQQATGVTTLDFARQNLFEPLGFGDVMWPQDPQGYYDGWSDVSIRPHDMAKLGFLFLHQGQWDDRQIASSEWVEEATRAHMTETDDDPYGYGWWIDPAVESGFRASGRGGQRIVVLPEWDMVVVSTGGGFELNEIAEPIVASFVDLENPLPANPEGESRLQEAIKIVAQPPEPQPTASLPDIARFVSNKTYIFDANPTGLESLVMVFDGASEAIASLKFNSRASYSVPIGLDGVYRFSPGPDGRPQVYRGAWTDPQTFLLEYDGITNNDHVFLQFYFEADQVEVSLQETAHELGLQFVGWIQQP